nr:transcriptional regulator Spx [uncultured Bacillus sp.]
MTVTIYGQECQSTKKARQWFKKYEIPFVERNIIKDPLTVHELQGILRLTVDGTDGIIAVKSNSYKELDLNIDELSLQELLELIHKQPRLLRSPIITDGKKIQAGYHKDEIRQFLPRKIRKTQWLNWQINNLNLAKS